MSFNSFMLDILATVIGGLALAFIFFLLKEKVFPLPTLDGSWVYQQKTIKTEYRPFDKMELTYLVLLWSEGNKILGTAEKIREVSIKGSKDFIGKDRTTVSITGHIQKNIFSKDNAVVHIFENGKERESSTVHILEMNNSQHMSGHFASTIANQEGSVNWEKITKKS